MSAQHVGKWHEAAQMHVGSHVGCSGVNRQNRRGFSLEICHCSTCQREPYAASQSITTVGVVEQATNVNTVDDLIRWTAKRSVFTADDLRGWGPSRDSPVKVADFLLAGHIDPAVPLDALIYNDIFSGRPPQSIAELAEDRYLRLQPYIQLGYEL